jgi:hypothetical protein
MHAASGCIALPELRSDDERIAGLFLPRTRTYVFLRALGLPVLDGCLVLSADETSLGAAAAIMASYGTRAIVRSDPVQLGSATIRGGDLWALSDLRAAADQYMALGRALLLLEPYERTANEWSFAILGSPQDHTFALELVGRGFDTGHLNRGRISPHEAYMGETVGSVPRVTTHVPFDHARYLQDLSSAGLNRDVPGAKPFPERLVSQVLRYFAVVERTRSSMFVLSGAVLQPGERLVFWDLYEPSQANR